MSRHKLHVKKPTTATKLTIQVGDRVWVEKLEREGWKKYTDMFLVPGTKEILPENTDEVVEYWTGQVAAWNGHEFEGAEVGGLNVSDGRIFFSLGALDLLHHVHSFALDDGQFENVMQIYYPVDPRMKESDVSGAIKAYPNEDGTAWLFKHTNEGTHHDYELNLISACDGVFQPYFRQLLSDSFTTHTDEVRRRNQNLYTLLSQFYGEVVGEAREIARQAYLGEREQSAHPREGWMDKDLTAAIARVKTKWKGTEDKNRRSDLTMISSAITYVENSLSMPAVETRWAKEKRLKDAAEAAAAEAEAQPEGE